MGIRFQQQEIVIPENEPFKYDRLGRKASIEVLTQTLRNLDGPATIAVDAAWGAGKTTFLRLWAKFLKDQGFVAIDYNAWQTDYAEDPFVPLATELTEGLAGRYEHGLGLQLRKLRYSIAKVAQAAALPTSRTVASAIPGIGRQLAYEISPSSLTPFESTTVRYSEVTAARKRFHSQLTDLAALIVEQTSLPLIVMIDELDRCRPTYAIELLETAKHLFNVDGIVFVLCLDRTQLEHSVKSVYGADFDSRLYLERFFDFDYRLPVPDRQEFAKELLDGAGVFDLAFTQRDIFGFSSDQRKEAMAAIINRPNLSLRQMLQLANRFAAGLASSGPPSRYSPYLLPVLFALRTLDPALYRDVLSGSVTDQDAIAAFVQGHEKFAQSWRVYEAVESLLIAIVCLSSAANGRERNDDMLPYLRNYEKQMAGRSNAQSLSARHARIIRVVKAACGFSVLSSQGVTEFIEVSDQMGMQNAVTLVELFPEDEPVVGMI